MGVLRAPGEPREHFSKYGTELEFNNFDLVHAEDFSNLHFLGVNTINQQVLVRNHEAATQGMRPLLVRDNTSAD